MMTRRSNSECSDEALERVAPIHLTWVLRHAVNRLLPLAIVAVGLIAYLLLQQRDLVQEVFASLSRLAPAAVVQALLLVIVQVLCQGLRFSMLVPSDVGASRLSVLRAFSVGEVFNALVPARVGDAVKVITLGHSPANQGSALSQVTGALLADKVVDAGTLVGLSAIALAAAGIGRLSATGLAGNLRWVAAGVAVVLALVLVLPLTVRRGRATGWRARARDFGRGVRLGFSTLREPRRVFGGAAFGVAGRFAEVYVIHTVSASLNIPLTAAPIMLAIALLNLGILVPLSIANLGAYEAALAFGLTLWGVPIASAIAIATAHHVIELTGIATTASLISIVQQWRTAPHSSHPPR